MTQEPQPSADKVAELQQQLAAASAEVARVHEELSRISPTIPPPPTGVPLATDPPIPGWSAGGPTAAGAVPYGSPAGSGLPTMDVSAYLDPAVLAQLRSATTRFGLDHMLGPMFGMSTAPPTPPSPMTVAALAEPPRRVPMGYRLATFDLSFYELFLLFLGAVAPIALWGLIPEARPFGLLAATLCVLVFRFRRYHRRIPILKWGKVATVTGTNLVSTGTYYSGMTYSNMRMRSARGWTSQTSWYSGPGHTTDISYSLDTYTGTLRLRGLAYVDGVVLADSRKPERAVCVSQYSYDLTPTPDGQWPGVLSSLAWGGIITTLVVELALVYLTVQSFVDLATR